MRICVGNAVSLRSSMPLRRPQPPANVQSGETLWFGCSGAKKIWVKYVCRNRIFRWTVIFALFLTRRIFRFLQRKILLPAKKFRFALLYYLYLLTGFMIFRSFRCLKTDFSLIFRSERKIFRFSKILGGPGYACSSGVYFVTGGGYVPGRRKFFVRFW